MNTTTTNNATTLFCDYYKQWITVYKEGAIRPVTMSKYNMAHQWLERLTPELTIGNLDRFAYQKLLNDYATSHERQTTMDFHHHLKCAILDAVDEGLIQRDPTRKAIIKGKTPREKKPKYLNQYELHKLLDNLDLKSEVNMDWLILLIAKTGMRFSEALALTPKDFDLSRQMLSVSKTWDYKNHSGFLPTKNKSSIRKIPLDWQTVMQFAELVKQLPEDEPIFVKGKIYNSTVNNVLARHCKEVEIPIISIHGLRHTHASLSDVTTKTLFAPGIAIVIAVIISCFFGSHMNVLGLGEDVARSLGIPVSLLRFLLLMLSSILAGCVVSYAGLLSFVGLIVPHIARRLFGNDMRLLVPLCALLGASFVLFCDTLGRVIAAPYELPAGIILSFVGGPFFLYLLLGKKGGRRVHA